MYACILKSFLKALKQSISTILETFLLNGQLKATWYSTGTSAFKWHTEGLEGRLDTLGTEKLEHVRYSGTRTAFGYSNT